MQGSRAGEHPEVARLRVQHNHLHRHWSSGTKAGMSYKQSDVAYKLHLGRIMELYLKDRRGPQEHRERQALDNGQSLRETPLSLLYGVNGLAVDTKNMTKIQKKREENFDNRVYILERLEREIKTRENQAEHASQREERIADHRERQSLRTASSRANSLSPSPSHARFESSLEGGGSLLSQSVERLDSSQFLGPSRSRTAGSANRSRYRRCLDPSMARDEVKLRLQYRLTDEQTRVYGEFVRMLSHFDHFDSVSILADALTDSVAEAGLEDFGGAQIPSKHRSPSPAARSDGTRTASPNRAASAAAH